MLLGLREPEPKKQPKPIAKVSEKKKKEIKENAELKNLDKEFYLEHWNSCPHKCEECNKHLGNKPLNLFFHHALPKRLYPEFRHIHENIIVLCSDHHVQAETDVTKLPYTYKRTKEIEKQLLKK
ncbi:MAG: hypothetical protein JST87_05450 [Bacteroidetes bacterium]|nr:hypothetical protein [Bacteroidota bacterium]